jgi:sialidase-1
MGFRQSLLPHRRGTAALAGLSAVVIAGTSLAFGAGPASAVPGTGQGDAAGHFSSQVLASNGDNAIDPVLGKYYRIVALANLGGGQLLAAYDGRPTGGDAPAANSIIQRRSTDGGKTWGEPTYIARGQVAAQGVQKYGFSDPSYVVDRETGMVFNFHVYSKDAGFASSKLGNDDADRNIISAEVSVSTDGGQTWSTDPVNQPTLPVPASYGQGSPYAGFAGPLITETVKPTGASVNGIANVGGVVGEFASSGEGIQLQYGPHKGRLIQQFAGTIIQPDGSKTIQAYSVYSDDHGKSWHMGTPVGSAMDENKVVELSNGDVMLNSRDSAGGGGRKVAISHDGGASYGAVTDDQTLTDPRNNAAITRMFPDAPAGSADAKKLLFSNADNPPFQRINGTIRYSCDDGATWSTSRAFAPGQPTSYSTVTPLGDGRYGVLYEGAGNAITFASFDAQWLGPLCGSLSVAPITAAPGHSADVTVKVVNSDEHAFSTGTVSLTLPAGWTSSDAEVPALPPGKSATVTLHVTAPSGTTGSVRAKAVYTAAQGHLDKEITATVSQ